MLFCVNQVGDEPGSFGDVGGRYVHLVEGESRGIMQRSGSIVL